MNLMLLKTILLRLFLSAAAITLLCCRTHSPMTPHLEVSTPAAPRPLRMPNTGSDSVYAGLSFREDVVSFYQGRQYRLAWFDSVQHSVGTDSMTSIIRHVRYFGLRPQRYHLTEIDTLAKNLEPRNVQRADALITDAFFLLLKDLATGVSRQNEVADSNQVVNLQHAIRSNTLLHTLRSVEPSYSQYHMLKSAIKTILDTTKAAVRSRLLQGEIDGEDPTMELMQAIEINLERWRSENILSEEGRFIFVNVPSFMLTVMNDGDKVIESRVIVGARKTPTPRISSKVDCIVIYPYWHVPRKISVEEYLPILQTDTSFITRNNFDVLDRRGRVLRHDSIDWKKFNKNYFPVSLRQREGKENSLGLIKFVFDNPYAVFVHDTNAKGPFRNNVRALSHGCIRLEKAFDVAHYLLTGMTEKKSQLLQKYLKQEQRRTISLSKPVPIYVRYFTCSVIDKKLYVYKDCYDLDRSLYTFLYALEKTQK